jgi:hypothetical protein
VQYTVHPVYQRLFRGTPSDSRSPTRLEGTTVSLPLSAKLTDGDTDDVIHAVHGILRLPH